MSESGRAVFVISVAAELAGMHPQTLRIYERKGLIDPSRTPGGTRRYSEEDIERLQVIQSLTGQGLNLEGVRQVLELQAENHRLRKKMALLREQLALLEKEALRRLETRERTGRHDTFRPGSKRD